VADAKPSNGYYVSLRDLELHSEGERRARDRMADQWGVQLQQAEIRLMARLDVATAEARKTRELVDAHDDRIQQLIGAGTFLKVVFGTSLLSAVLSLILIAKALV
jgi:hypothetical protein